MVLVIVPFSTCVNVFSQRSRQMTIAVIPQAVISCPFCDHKRSLTTPLVTLYRAETAREWTIELGANNMHDYRR